MSSASRSSARRTAEICCKTSMQYAFSPSMRLMPRNWPSARSRRAARSSASRSARGWDFFFACEGVNALASGIALLLFRLILPESTILRGSITVRLRGVPMDHSHQELHPPGSGAPPAIAIDPVCGMEVDTAATGRVVVHDGISYYFCNDKCVALFKANPNEFVADTALSAEEKSAA